MKLKIYHNLYEFHRAVETQLCSDNHLKISLKNSRTIEFCNLNNEKNEHNCHCIRAIRQFIEIYYKLISCFFQFDMESKRNN
jgi:hypothetical protein